jgi:hypothetical protein
VLNQLSLNNVKTYVKAGAKTNIAQGHQHHYIWTQMILFLTRFQVREESGLVGLLTQSNVEGTLIWSKAPWLPAPASSYD